MIRRDFLQAEIAKIAQALAKILGLKEAGKKQEANDLIRKNLIQSFDLTLEEIIRATPDDFKNILSTHNFPKEKLDLLSQFLLESVSPFQQNPETFLVLNHVLAIYKLLEQVHHTQSFENLNKQQLIIQFLDQTNG